MRIALIVCAVLVAATFAWIMLRPPRGWHGIPYDVGEAALRRTASLRIGMTEAKVFRTLGLQRYDLHAKSSGSGSPRSWPTWYFPVPGKGLMIRWNLKASPPTLVGYQVTNVKTGDVTRG